MLVDALSVLHESFSSFEKNVVMLRRLRAHGAVVSGLAGGTPRHEYPGRTQNAVFVSRWKRSYDGPAGTVRISGKWSTYLQRRSCEDFEDVLTAALDLCRAKESVVGGGVD